MSTASSGATADYSNGPRLPGRPRGASPRVAAGRSLLALTGLAGVVALAASTPTTIIRLQVAGSSQVPGYDTLLSGWDRHGPALAVLALLGLVLLALALRGARAAQAALALVGIVALVIVLRVDAGDLDETGSLSQAYDEASAGAGLGFYLETAGAVLLLLSGGGLLIAGLGRDRA